VRWVAVERRGRRRIPPWGLFGFPRVRRERNVGKSDGCGAPENVRGRSRSGAL